MDMISSILLAEWLTKPAWMWLVFIAGVGALLAFDLGVFHRTVREIGARESLSLSAVYMALALAFGGWVWWSFGAPAGAAYLTGFAVEKALALDNVFVIATIFAFLGVPRSHQHRVLFWGILGVLVLRAVMIGLGAVIVAEAAWVLSIFAVVLVATGVQMLAMADRRYDVGSSPILRLLKRRFAVTDTHHGERFFVRLPHPETGAATWFMTPAFVALVLIEIADVVFAVDSVPAVFAITTDPFIVYTSNIFAILGLRALYFALAAIVDRFRYLKPALAIVLIFIGLKVLAADALGIDKVPAVVSLGVTVGILASGILFSLWRTRNAAAGPSVP